MENQNGSFLPWFGNYTRSTGGLMLFNGRKALNILNSLLLNHVRFGVDVGVLHHHGHRWKRKKLLKRVNFALLGKSVQMLQPLGKVPKRGWFHYNY